MFKKTLLIATFILFTAMLIYGAVNRTMAKSTTEATQQAVAQGNGRNQAVDPAAAGERQYRNTHEPLNQGGSAGRQGLNQHEPLNQGADQARQGSGRQGGSAGQAEGARGNGQDNDAARQGQGSQAQQAQPRGQAGQGQGQGPDNQTGQAQPLSGNGRGQGRGQENAAQPGNGRGQEGGRAEPVTTTSLSGVIVQAPAAGVELILETSAGDVQIGTGPNYLGEIGFVLNAGDEVTVSGFWEDGEFKASAITRLVDGTAVTLRDDSGRPMWSGAARGGRGAGSASAAGQGPRS